MLHRLKHWLAMCLPALLAAGPVSSPTTMPATRPAPRNQVRPASLPFMIGVNLCGAEFGENNLPGEYGKAYIYPTAKELDDYHKRGIDLIRLPFRWERMQQTLLGPIDEAEWGRLDTFLKAARERGMKVIPEPHNFARYRGKVIGTPEVPNAAFADFWMKLAAKLKGREEICALGLVNEPHATDGLWPASAQAATDAIRSVDDRVTILIPGDGWSGAADWLKNNRDLWINDPANRIAYECHLYFDKDRSGRYTKSYAEEGGRPDIGEKRLADFLKWLEERNAIGFVGEFGVPPDEPWLTALSNFTAHLKKNQLSGTYWAGGPWWGNYPLSVEPKNGKDRPQMAALRASNEK